MAEMSSHAHPHAAAADGPSPGRFDGPAHRFPVRVYYEDTDAAGIVYHANYLRFCERARTEMMRLLGASHSRMVAETGVSFAVRTCEIDYLRPARLDDALEIVTRIVDIGGASLDAEQRVFRTGAGGTDAPEPGPVELVRVRLKLACMTREGRPVRLPIPVRRALEVLSTKQSQG